MNKKETSIKKSALAPTILVSGGAGFIGSHLIEALLLKDASVVALDNFSTGQRNYLTNVLNNPKFTLIECDIKDGIPKSIESVDYIFHLASSESHLYDEKDITLDALLTNAVGTKNLLELAKTSNAKFVLVSSTDVYQGLISSLDLSSYFGQAGSEEKKYSHLEAKRFAEAITFEYHKKYKVNARIARLPRVYGPRMNFTSNELGRLLNLLLERNDLTIYGDGLEKDYYLYITDTVSGLIKALFSESTEGQIYTFSGGEGIATIELTYLLKGLSETTTNVIFKSSNGAMKPKEIKTTNTEELRWGPKVNLKEGVIKTLKWYGYEFNNHHFKPLKYVKKEEENKDGITTIKPEITHSDDFISSSAITTILPHTASHSMPAEQPKKETGKIKFKLPKINFPTFYKKLTPPKLPRIRLPKSPILFPILGVAVALLVALIIFAITPLMQTYYYANKGYGELAKAKENIEKLNLDEAATSGNKALENFNKSQDHLNDLGWLFLISGQEKRLRTYSKLLKIAQYTSIAITDTTQGIKPLTQVWESVKPNSKETMDQTTISRISVNFKSARENLERAQGEVKSLDYNLLPKKYKGKVEETVAKIPEALEALTIAQELIETLPDTLAINSNKKYLILFQNPNELRATGGFIGSYAVTALENGKIKEITIDDIYNVDGLLDLSGLKLPAYEPIKKYAKQDYLRIRDANWQASYPSSATEISKLFETATGAKFDGIIAIDMFLIRDLLKATGPLFLTSYNEEISSENVYEKAQYYSEASYTNGSQQKKAFLTVLGSKLLETIFSLPQNKISDLTKEAFKDLSEKHILVYIPNSKISAVISDEGWSGEVNPTKTDYLYIVDSNVGANKANFFVTEEANYQVQNTYRDGSLEANLNITYTHTQKNSVWPGGVYTDYLRVLVPAESFLHKVTIRVNGGEVKDITKDIVIGKEAGKRTFETPLIVNPGEKVEVNFNYTLPSSISLGIGEKVYSLYVQKQPGTDGIPISITFKKPFGKDVISQDPAFTKVDSETYVYKTNLFRDLRATVMTK